MITDHELPRKRMAASVLFTDERCRALLCEPTYKDYWDFPGGAVETGESPRAAARREIKEELGLDVTPGRTLLVDWVPARPGRSDGLIMVFAGPALSDAEKSAIRLPPEELRSCAWCAESEARQRMSALLVRRLAAALLALKNGNMTYLEGGFDVV